MKFQEKFVKHVQESVLNEHNENCKQITSECKDELIEYNLFADQSLTNFERKMKQLDANTDFVLENLKRTS